MRVHLVGIALLVAVFLLLNGVVLANDGGDMISAAEGKQKVASGALLVDVRTPEEFASGHVSGALNIPLDDVEQRLPEFGNDKAREIVLYCRTGRRSGIAEKILKSHGFLHAANAGGYEAWVNSK